MEHTRHTSQSERSAAAKRVIGLERHYRCSGCGHEHRSWSRLRTCTTCGEPLAHAVIRRAALI
jgi:hypothetical protein